MGNEIATPQTFQERLFERIRADIGSLMTDEELKKLVESAIEREFFRPRVVKTGAWHEETKPPQLVEIVREAIGPKVREAVDAWLREHPEKVEAALQTALAGGLASATVRAFDTMLSGQFQQMSYNIEQALRNALSR